MARRDAREAIVEGARFDDIANRPRTSNTGGDGAAGWVEAETIATLAPVSIMEDQTLYAPQAGEQEDAPPPLPEVQEGALYGDRSTAVKATDRWVYVFVPTWQMDGEEATVSWTVREYEVHGDETYTRVDFGERSKESGGRAAMMLPVAGTEAVATPAVWVSPFRLPKAHVTGALSDELKRREERSPSALTPVELEAATLGERNKRGWRPADGRLQEADNGYQLHVVNVRAAARDLHDMYTSYLEQSRRWRELTAHTLQATRMTQGVLEQRDDLRDNVRVSEMNRWLSQYEIKKKAVQDEVKRRADRYVRLLRHRAMRCVVLQHECVKEAREDGEALVADLFDRLSECEPGQQLMKALFKSSGVGKDLDEETAEELMNGGREGVQKDTLGVSQSPYDVAQLTLDAFNYAKQVFGVGRTITKRYFDIVTEYSVIIPGMNGPLQNQPGSVAASLYGLLLLKSKDGEDRTDMTPPSKTKDGNGRNARTHQSNGILTLQKKNKQRGYTSATHKRAGRTDFYYLKDGDDLRGEFLSKRVGEDRIKKIRASLDSLNACLAVYMVFQDDTGSIANKLDAAGDILGAITALRAANTAIDISNKALQTSLKRLGTSLRLLANGMYLGTEKGTFAEKLATGCDVAAGAINLAASYEKTMQHRRFLGASRVDAQSLQAECSRPPRQR